MKRSQVVKALSNYFSSIDLENENDINALFAEKAIDFLYELDFMRPVEWQSSGCLHSMRENCNCQPTIITEWTK